MPIFNKEAFPEIGKFRLKQSHELFEFLVGNYFSVDSLEQMLDNLGPVLDIDTAYMMRQHAREDYQGEDIFRGTGLGSTDYLIIPNAKWSYDKPLYDLCQIYSIYEGKDPSFRKWATLELILDA